MAQATEKVLDFESWDDDTLYINHFQDITGWTWMLIIEGEDGVEIDKEVTSHDDPTEGQTSFDLSHEDTSNLSGFYDYKIRYETDSGNKTTVLKGSIYFAGS